MIPPNVNLKPRVFFFICCYLPAVQKNETIMDEKTKNEINES